MNCVQMCFALISLLFISDKGTILFSSQRGKAVGRDWSCQKKFIKSIGNDELWLRYKKKAQIVDPRMIRNKAQLIRALGLGDGMVWALDLDDFRNRCGDTVHPLLTQIDDVLRNPPSDKDQHLFSAADLISFEMEFDTEINSAQQVSSESEWDSENSPEEVNITEIDAELTRALEPSLSNDFKVVCYFTNWPWYRQNGDYDVTQLSEYLDWIALMTYDYHGQWDRKTGHVASMYDYPSDVENFNVNFSINYWLKSVSERKKLIMAMPMYGQSFIQASDHDLSAYEKF
uniref:GH18 domain-containing protein n=1 Tax=Glossina palpalis gambiensis TaxID=67801 RepID=A0A1B0BET0_9MUSC